MALNKNVGNAIGDKEENDRSILGMVYLGNFTDGDDIQAKKERWMKNMKHICESKNAGLEVGYRTKSGEVPGNCIQSIWIPDQILPDCF